MKKAVILAIMSIILSSFASALISIDSLPRSAYNIGDKFPITGTVQEASSVSGFLKFIIKCNGNEFPLQLVPVSLNANELRSLKDLGMPQVTISPSMNGACFILASLIAANGTVYSNVESTQFEATKELNAKFSVDEPRVQAGTPLKITGTVLRKDGTAIEGVAELYFNNLGNKYLIDTVEIHKGLLEYSYQTKSSAPGAYTIDIVSRDVFGNEATVINAASFFLSNKLDVRVMIDRQIALPGDTVKITGDVRTILDKAPEDATVEVAIGPVRVPVTLKDGNFETEFKIPENIKSGKHDITATASDKLGNSGSDGTKIDITPVATTLSMDLDKASYLPGDTLGVTVYLYDQGSDLIDAVVPLSIITPNGNTAITTDAKTNVQEKFKIPQFAMPGKWKLAASTKSLSSAAEFEIEYVSQLETNIEGERLLITNTGNVEHTKRVVATLSNGVDTYKAYSNENILPNKTIMIELSRYAPNGQYTVELELPQKIVQLNASIVNGKRQINLNIFFAILVALLVFVLLYNALIKPAPVHKYQKKSKYSPRMKGIRTKPEEDVVELKSEGPVNDDVQDFRNRILKDIRKTEEQNSRPSRRDFRGNGNPGSGFANMFG